MNDPTVRAVRSTVGTVMQYYVTIPVQPGMMDAAAHLFGELLDLFDLTSRINFRYVTDRVFSSGFCVYRLTSLCHIDPRHMSSVTFLVENADSATAALVEYLAFTGHQPERRPMNEARTHWVLVVPDLIGAHLEFVNMGKADAID